MSRSDDDAPHSLAEHTIQRDAAEPSATRELRPVDHLFLVLEGARPLSGGARWSLEGVDEVRFRRGSTRAMAREKDGSRTILSLKVPDGLLSSSHARLLRGDSGWSLVDDGSTNGTFVDGARIQVRALSDGASFELGAAHFILRVGMPTPHGSPAESESAKSSGRAHGLASLVPAYADTLVNDFARVAMANVSVLLLGESGTGKEVLAAGTHAVSGRSGPFVPVNCGALTATLMESQLFGHMKGSFSGALRDEPGFVRASDGGTLFLDEIGDLPGPSQAALLRVLETREVVPVGSTRAVPVNLRVVSATLKSVGSLRPDLHARLAGFTHVLPPLRDRMEDLGLLFAELLQRAAGERAAAIRVSPEAGRALLAHDWPLNVRELNQALQVALALAQGTTLDLKTFPASIRGEGEPESEPRSEGEAGDDAMAKSGRATLPSPIGAAPAVAAPPVSIPDDDASLRAFVLAALETHKGNVSDVARALGRTRMQIHRWMKRFEIDPATFRR
jgi:DNA-binding NtrC family response regulator